MSREEQRDLKPVDIDVSEESFGKFLSFLEAFFDFGGRDVELDHFIAIGVR
jgi:hypothetical protein